MPWQFPIQLKDSHLSDQGIHKQGQSREEIEIWFHPSNMKNEDGFSMNIL
jgi:hypothetical protein